LIVTLCVLGVAGCSRSTPAPATGSESKLSFEMLDADTAGISQGEPLLTAFEPYRDAGGAIRARGRIRFPDGTRLQLTLYRPGVPEMLARTQFLVSNGSFDSPPLVAPDAALPQDRYRFEMVTYFDSSWQSPAVLTATANGRAVRGPGIVRGQNGVAAFTYSEDQRL
jgi:hypothetical protein